LKRAGFLRWGIKDDNKTRPRGIVKGRREEEKKEGGKATVIIKQRLGGETRSRKKRNGM